MAKQWHLWVSVLLLGGMFLAACGPLGVGPVEKTIYVGPKTVDCVGVAPQKCLLVTETPEDEWTMYYDPIAGFDYEPGYDYQLRISEERIDNPPADASSLKWTLIEVVEKRRTLEGTVWSLTSYLNGDGESTEVLPGSSVTLEFEDGQLKGNAGCNSYFGSYQLDSNDLKIGDLGWTEMYCAPDEVMAQESDYLATLASAASYRRPEEQLVMTDGANGDGEVLLTFSMLQPAPLVGTLWRLETIYGGDSTASSTLAGTEIAAVFDDRGQLAGSSGCNNYSSQYSVDGSSITISPIASTMMMCDTPGGIMEQEAAYLGALQSAESFEIKVNRLLLSGTGGQALLAFSVVEPAPLADTQWDLTAYNNGRGGVTSVLQGTEISALFGIDGSLSGSAGCNNYNSSYKSSGDTIQIGPAATTRKMCPEPEGIMEQESAYLAALEMATHYAVEGDQLVLRNPEGSRMAQYRAKVETATSGRGALANMTYQSEWTQSGYAPLVDGEYREPAAPGSATETVVTLTEHFAAGDLNGQPASAVVLAADPGGSGTFFDLAVVVEQDGKPVNAATTSLGDRVQINDIQMVGGEIIVDMVQAGPDDPMCCPTQHVIQTFALEGDQLVQTSSRVIDN